MKVPSQKGRITRRGFLELSSGVPRASIGSKRALESPRFSIKKNPLQITLQIPIPTEPERAGPVPKETN
jgi:hypothetical protein